jgi:lipopolysaccharide assembly protein B
VTEFLLLVVLVALLAGLALGKAWERYKLRDGRWIDRRRLRDAPHYMLGLNCLVDGHVDQAIEELTQAFAADSDAIEIQMMLGNLYRMKGQVARAIHVHQTLLRQPGLRTVEQVYVLLCLGLDFRHGGFVDRALETFQNVLRLDPDNRYALVYLQKLHEDQHQWAEAVAVRERIARLTPVERSEDRQVLGFLRAEIGRSRLREGDAAGAAAEFAEAIDIEAGTAPAWLHLGDVREQQGDLRGAVEAWEGLARHVPDRAHLAFDRLERAWAALGTPHRFGELCRARIAQHPRDWRTRLALSRQLAATHRPREAFDLLLEALPHNPHGLVIHEAIWQALTALALEPPLVARYIALTREAVFYLDPHVCVRCRYRSTELLWQCPQCHGWNTFVDELMAPAREAPTVETT